jgi:tripartite-type tricarboxylate transporter receptor subunit TctC
VQRAIVRFVALAILGTVTATAVGQTYPSKPIKVIVGFPPGGGNDIFARLVGAKLQEALGQAVVVENKPGANGIIAIESVAKSPPDGYTLLVGATGQITINPVVYSKLPYDPLRDLAPISATGSFPLIVTVHPSVPANSIQELIAYAKANPDKLSYSAGSTSFQLATEMFKQMTGTRITHIPYKGSAQSINALLTGDVQLSFIDSPPVMPQIRAGKLKALAVTSSSRSPSLPEVPTVAESGVPGYEMMLWSAFFVPAGTPREIVSKLHAEVARIVHLPDVKEKFDSFGVVPIGNTPEELAEMIKDETAKYRAVATAGNIKAE